MKNTALSVQSKTSLLPFGVENIVAERVQN